MADPREPGVRNAAAAPAAELARSYGDLIGPSAWEVDVTNGPSAAGTQTGAAAPSAPPALARLLEALLFVGGAPLTAETAALAIRGLTPAQFSQTIASLNRHYRRQGRPYSIQAHSQGYTLALRPRFRSILQRLYGPTREARLSPPAIDVLALVAYRQPVTKQEIDSIRGLESGALIRQLVRRNLIAVVQRGEAGRSEVFYGTTPRFLELFQLSSLDDLPQTADLERL